MSDSVYNSLSIGVLLLFLVVVLILVAIPILNKIDYNSGAGGEVMIRFNPQQKKAFIINTGADKEDKIESSEFIKYFIIVDADKEIINKLTKEKEDLANKIKKMDIDNVCKLPEILSDEDVGINTGEIVYFLPCKTKTCDVCANIEVEKKPVICNVDKVGDVENLYLYMNAIIICRNKYKIDGGKIELEEARPIIYLPLHE